MSKSIYEVSRHLYWFLLFIRVWALTLHTCQALVVNAFKGYRQLFTFRMISLIMDFKQRLFFSHVYNQMKRDCTFEKSTTFTSIADSNIIFNPIYLPVISQPSIFNNERNQNRMIHLSLLQRRTKHLLFECSNLYNFCMVSMLLIILRKICNSLGQSKMFS